MSKYDEYLNISVINAIKAGDEAALNTLYKKYEKYINFFCLKKGKSINGMQIIFFDEDKSKEIKDGLCKAAKKFKF